MARLGIPEAVHGALEGRPASATIRKAAALHAAGDLAALERSLLDHLESGAAAREGDAHAAIAYLLHLRYQDGRSARFADLVRAPWSPFRDQCDEGYDRSYAAAMVATESYPLPLKRRQRFYELVLRLRATRGVPGDVVECGCFLGLSSSLLCRELAAEDASFAGQGYHVFDSFQGLSEPLLEDEIPDDDPLAAHLRPQCERGRFAAPLEMVRHHLGDFPRIAWHPGWIPTTFAGLPEKRYRFVHVDVDLYEPTDEVLRYFMPRMSPGGAIVSDDYSWPGARLAVQEFAERNGLSFEVTGFGQAVFRVPA